MARNVDDNDAEDLDLSVENYGELYPKKMLIVKRMKQYIDQGLDAAAKSPEPWITWYRLGVNQYCRENGQENRSRFPFELIAHLAKERVKYEYDKIGRGEYNY